MSFIEFTLRRDRLNVRPAYTRSDSYQNEVFEDSHHYTRTTPDSIYQTALERAYLLCLATAVQLPRNVLNHLSHVYLSVVKVSLFKFENLRLTNLNSVNDRHYGAGGTEMRR